MDFDIVQFFVQPWGQYRSFALPDMAVAGSDYLWLEITSFDPELLVTEVRRLVEGKTDDWIGTSMSTVPGLSMDRQRCPYIINCDPNHHASVLPVTRLIIAKAEELKCTVLTRPGS